MNTLLPSINEPRDIQQLTVEQLVQLAGELRVFIIETVGETGGHLASNLGTIELTLALHYCFNSPDDRIIWDVGHQSYAHKILTGRREQFRTLRQYKGIAGFPKRSESVHDAFDTGHASTSLSAALGMAAAKSLTALPDRTIAIIGDGSLTGGMALEALNQAGHLRKNLIVILNDNEMSISKNVGALSTFISRKMTSSRYRELKKEMLGVLAGIPAIGGNILQFARRAENSLKGFLTPGTLFESLGFEYVGPIPGHDLPQLIELFRNAATMEGPVLIHLMTTKGKGYPPAESTPEKFHGVGPFDIVTGQSTSKAAPATFTGIFGETLLQLAEKDESLVAITAAMPDGTGLTPFAHRYPERFFDVGIAEQHACVFAAGLAVAGMKPVVAIYSSFTQRAYDQLFHDICLQNLPVVIVMDRAGLVGDDGPTHHGVFDLSFLRHLPGLTLMAPKDENELRHMLNTALHLGRPVAIRYPRGAGHGVPLDSPLQILPIGTGEILAEGTDVSLIAIGSTVYPALEAARILARDGIQAGVINARFVKPLDRELITAAATRTGALVTIEENGLMGGFGSAVLEALSEQGLTEIRCKRLGIPDHFIEQGSQGQLRKDVGIDADGIASAVGAFLRHPGKHPDQTAGH